MKVRPKLYPFGVSVSVCRIDKTRLLMFLLPYTSAMRQNEKKGHFNQPRGWLIITMKDNKTIEIVFLKNESRTMIIFVSESQSQNISILGRS
jgi:hypothetical protein